VIKKVMKHTFSKNILTLMLVSFFIYLFFGR
jgi:hypothetical protein